MSETASSPIEAMRMYSEAELGSVQNDIELERQNERAMFELPAELVQAPAITICSVWPFPVDSQPFHHGGVGRRIYSMAAGSPEKPSYLHVRNTWDWVQRQEGSQDVGYFQAPIYAGQIARDLVKHWTGDHPGNRRGKKGIGVVRNLNATPEEIKELAGFQKAFLMYLVDRADENWDHGKREKIGHEHRRAFKMLGLDEAQHAWVRSRVQVHNSCPWCESRVPASVLICGTCRGSIIDYYRDRMEDFNPASWPKIAKELDRLIASAKKQK